MKKLIIAGTLLAGATAFSLTSCNDSHNDSTTTTDSTSMINEADKPADTAVVMTDTVSAEQKFVFYIVEKNAKELAWLQAGIDHGGAEVKSHAKMMMADHKKMGKEVSDYVAAHNLTLPEVDTAGAVDINDKKGKDFDKAWVDKMVDEHEELLDKLKDAQDDVADPDLKGIITKATPVVQSHLDMAKKSQDKMNK